MTDPIKAALEAAGESVRRAMAAPGCCVDVKPCEMPPCHCARVGAVAAVAAFLRALPEEFTAPVRFDSGTLPVPFSEAWPLLAAAAEEAARDA